MGRWMDVLNVKVKKGEIMDEVGKVCLATCLQGLNYCSFEADASCFLSVYVPTQG